MTFPSTLFQSRSPSPTCVCLPNATFASSEHSEFPFCRLLPVLDGPTAIDTKMCHYEKWFVIILTNISSLTNKVKQISVSYLYFLIGELIGSCYFGHLSIEILILIDIYELFIY